MTSEEATVLAERLEVPFDGVCLACLGFVESAIRDGDEENVRLWVRRMTPDLWNDSLGEILPRILEEADQTDEVQAARADVERDGARSNIARAVVVDLASRLVHDTHSRRVSERARVGRDWQESEDSMVAVNESLARNAKREKLAVELAAVKIIGQHGRVFGEDDVQIDPMAGDPVPALESVDGGYWVAARIWVDAYVVEDAL